MPSHLTSVFPTFHLIVHRAAGWPRLGSFGSQRALCDGPRALTFGPRRRALRRIGERGRAARGMHLGSPLTPPTFCFFGSFCVPCHLMRVFIVWPPLPDASPRPQRALRAALLHPALPRFTSTAYGVRALLIAYLCTRGTAPTLNTSQGPKGGTFSFSHSRTTDRVCGAQCVHRTLPWRVYACTGTQ